MNSDEIKKYILNKYNNIEINNNSFLDEKVFNDFDMDFIVNKLLKLHINNAYTIYMNLYAFDHPQFKKDMIKYIMLNNIDYFISDREDLFFDNNLFCEYKNLIHNKDYNYDYLKEIENKTIEINKDKEIYQLDISFYEELVIIQKLLKDREINYKDISSFVNLLTNMLRKKVIKEYDNYDVNYDYYINEIISSLLISKISISDFYKYMNNSNSIKSLLTICKLGIYTNLSTTIDVIGGLKGKKINNLYNEFESIYGEKEILINYSRERIMKILTNMSILLKIDNVSNIIRHFPKDKEKANRLLKAFENIDLRNIKVNNNKIVYNEELIKFIIGNNLNEPNSLLNLIYEDKTNLAN